jgi:hypothetical protein
MLAPVWFVTRNAIIVLDFTIIPAAQLIHPESNFRRGEKMTGKKVNPFVQHVVNNTEKAKALIGKHTNEGDKCLYWAVAKTGPHYIFTLFLGGFFGLLSEKKYIIAVNQQKFIIIGIKKAAIEEISYQSLPIGNIQKSAVKKYPLGSNLRLDLLDGKVWTFKDLNNDYANKLKEAIDSAQSS